MSAISIRDNAARLTLKKATKIINELTTEIDRLKNVEGKMGCDIECLLDLWDMPSGSDELSRDARAELSALRARVADQAVQLGQARIVITEALESLELEGVGGGHSASMCRAWLAANAPAQEGNR